MNIKNYFKGILIGIVDSIPGISGGTIAVIVGIYDRLISSINCLASTQNYKKKIIALLFILPIILGVLTGLFVSSVALEYLFEKYEEQVIFFFIGLILGSLHFITHKAQTGATKMKFYHYIIIALCVIMFFSFTWVRAGSSKNDIIEFSPSNFYMFILMGAIASSIMIIPGISGSFVLMLLGYYKTFIHIVSSRQIVPLLLFGVGAVVGFVLISKIITKLLYKYHTLFYSIVIGLVLGSVIPIFPFFTPKLEGLVSVLTMFLGFVFATFLGYRVKDENYSKQRTYILVFFSALSGLCIAGVLYSQKDNIPQPLLKNHPLIIAHRGGAYEGEVENTLAAYKKSYSYADMFEFDLQLTKDNVIVLFHDDTTSRLTGLEKQDDITDYTYQELLDMDFSNGVSEEGKKFNKSKDGRITTLEEIFQQFPDKLILIEVKEDAYEMMDSLALMFEKYNRWDNTIISSFDTKVMKDYKKKYPKFVRAAGESESADFLKLSSFGLTLFYRPEFEFMILPFHYPDPDGPLPSIKKNQIQAAKKLGMEIIAWTIDDEDVAKWLYNNGIYGIITNQPLKMKNFYSDLESKSKKHKK